MILPGSYSLTFAILILGMLCWGCWAGTLRLAKWRYELYYFDFAIGLLIAALIAGFTFGTLGWDGFSVEDDLRLAGKRQDLFGLVAGAVFNLGNIMLVGAVSLTGMAVSFPLTMGVGLITGVAIGLATGGGSSVLLASAGCGLVLGAIGFVLMTWKELGSARLTAAQVDGAKKARRPVSYKGIVVALAAGLFIGSFYPLVSMARAGENGLGPYSVCVVFAVGVVLSTLVFDLFLMNLPLQGKHLEVAAFFRGSAMQHLVGILGGMLWMTGAVCMYVAGRAEGPAQVATSALWTAGQVPAILAALLGILGWKELAIASGRVRTFVGAGLFLYAAGIATVAMAIYRGSR